MGVVAHIFSYIDVSIFLVAVAFFLITYQLLFTRRRDKLPPGPTPAPIFGNIPYVTKHVNVMYKELVRLKEKYGDIITLYMGDVPVVVLNSYESIKEALVDQPDAANDRWNLISEKFYERFEMRPGVIQSSGERWKNIRRKVLVGLRDMGVGKKTIENKIIEEAGFIIEEIEKNGSNPFSLLKMFNYSVSNVICGVVFGERFEYSDKKFQHSIDDLNTLVRGTAMTDPLLYSPKITLLYTWAFKEVALLEKLNRKLADMYSKKIQEHQQTFKNGEIRDLIDLCLEAEEKDEYFKGGTILGVVHDLFAAGSETSFTTLMWLFLNLIRNPEVQEKCFKELDEVFGSDTPNYDAREKCHFIMATLNENQRLSNIAPFTLAHVTNGKATVGGYDLPHGTVVLCNLYAVHMDENNFKNAHEFKPERWLDENGKFQKLEKMMPFGAGKRICAGENLAKMELFLFFTMLLQRFKFVPKEGAVLPKDDECVSGGTNSAPYYEVVAVSR